MFGRQSSQGIRTWVVRATQGFSGRNSWSKVAEEDEGHEVTRSAPPFIEWGGRSGAECQRMAFGSLSGVRQLSQLSGNLMPWIEPPLNFHQVSCWRWSESIARIGGKRRRRASSHGRYVLVYVSTRKTTGLPSWATSRSGPRKKKEIGRSKKNKATWAGPTRLWKER